MKCLRKHVRCNNLARIGTVAFTFVFSQGVLPHMHMFLFMLISNGNLFERHISDAKGKIMIIIEHEIMCIFIFYKSPSLKILRIESVGILYFNICKMLKAFRNVGLETRSALPSDGRLFCMHLTAYFFFFLSHRIYMHHCMKRLT